ncbi:hypothetical protein IKE07_02405 [Candidatus Saccharibacteria bacterium]|nr:hypothetical protein [Candidatus Saccharibacteria bacterium]
MGQFGQTNDLQEAIDQVANNDGSDAVNSDDKVNNIQDQLGVPPSPDSFPAPENTNFFSDIMPPAPGEVAAPDAPNLDGAIPEAPAAPDAPASAPIDIVNPVPAKEEPKADESKPEVAPAEETPAEPKADEPLADAPSAEQILSDSLAPEDENLKGVRENILRDLMPLMPKVQGTAEEKFDIYEDAINTLEDKNLVSDAYNMATQIEDESKRAESLMKLMQAIDKK